MRSARSTIPKKIKELGQKNRIRHILLCTTLFILGNSSVHAQDNSPYSRYGLGDIVPNTNISNRGMGGITSGFRDPLLINFNNPASYSAFLTYLEARSKTSISGRVVLDVGMNFDNRTLREVNPPAKFTATNALFSYLQVGIPVRNNWGISFGLRPVTRIGYNIIRKERLFDPVSGNPIDSAVTEFTGEGGTFLPFIGTGVAIKNLSVGVNVGYLFGRKEYSARRALLNDSVQHYNSNSSTRASFGQVFFQGGAQYRIPMKEENSLTLGVSGNMKHDLKASQDVTRVTSIRDVENGDIRLDSVFEQNNIKGKIVYPSSITAGFVYDRKSTKDHSGFLFGLDYVQTKWEDYSYYGNTDAVTNTWELRAGLQLKPIAKRNYFSNVEYRLGGFYGKDYINVANELKLLGFSFGVGLPIPNNNPLSRGQFTKLNLALEYIKRGNDNNLLKENLFRISLGLNFSDIWFSKRMYE